METPILHDFVLPAAVARVLKARAFDPARTILDLGCGRRKLPGAIGVDAFPDADADVTHDLNRYPYPFETGAADLVILRHVIEHLDDVVATMREIARLLRPGGHAFVLTPHFSDASSWIDPTHRWHLATRSIEEAAKGQLALRMSYVKLRKPWRRLGLEALINNAPFQTRVPRRVVSWENDWCFLLRGGEMSFLLERV